ncbi:HD-GYP domain-containing protein [Caballeronia mineralivorans]|jgi:putative nucleotidyltransferase with HDIG domain|uniref:HD-GYP domain-containing protein n=1 Tax=Caballeronia mineralivorans TaxID=2010198 RepID=UPI0023F0CA71|nr:HD-GYP domain-containing protein [Caballeronia mineralivorans]MDB5780816.1 phosphodiesterase [Caballeronia mineralivorans]
MLKTVAASSLRPGMFLHSLDRRWIDHPFWKNSFLLTAGDIEKIVSSGITSIVIDTDRGLECADDSLDSVESGGEAEDDQLPVTTRPQTSRKPIGKEIEHAKRLFESASNEMKLVFQQARMGKVVAGSTMMPLVETIAASVMRNPHALISVARLKHHDGYTYMHSVAVCALMTALARELGLDEPGILEAGVAGLLHDLGKALMPLAVLNKPGKLSTEEFEVAKKHAYDGWKMLQSADVTAGVLEVALHHHEKINGRGYPDGLVDKAIPLLARMGAVCDVYDAVTSERPYKSSWHPTQALRSMASWDGQFDKTILAAFISTVGIYPVGAVVRLESGFLAVVLDQGSGSILTPIVKMFFSCKSNQPVLPQVVDLRKIKDADRIVAIEDPRLWNLPPVDDLWLNQAAPFI